MRGGKVVTVVCGGEGEGPKAGPGVSRWLRVGKTNPFGGGFLFANGPHSHTVLLFECGDFSAPSFLLLLLFLLACLRPGLALQDGVLFPSLFTSL